MIIVFSGTTEGRELSGFLSENRIEHIVCVATDSGEVVMEKNDYATVCVGRMNEARMREFLSEKQATLVVDATHPYAVEVTKNIQTTSDSLGIKYLRVSRDGEAVAEYEAANYYDSAKDCADEIERLSGNVLLTTGSKELECYTRCNSLLDRLYVRVLPNRAAMDICMRSGIDERRVIAMYGPHSLDMNIATIKQYNISHIVTKQSGHIGGYDEKIEAAKKTGARLHIIRRPEGSSGVSIAQCKKLILEKVGMCGNTRKAISITLVGIGMGGNDMLTIAGKKAIDECDMIFGAKRMLDTYSGKADKYPVYEACDIKNTIKENVDSYVSEKIKVAVLFSGDTGIYSGADKLYQSLREWDRCEEIRIIPGISSFSYFASKLGVSYTDAALMSLHGKSKDEEALTKIRDRLAEGNHIFVLMSGKGDFEILKRIITESVGESLAVDIGYQLSYADEQIIYTDSEAMIKRVNELPEGLFIARVYDKRSR